MATSPDKGTAVITLRLPRSLHKRLRALADAERRSLNAQVITMLERAAQADEEGVKR